MTPESVRREILLLASSGWAGPWQVLLRVRELDPSVPANEIATMAQVSLEALAHQGLICFVPGDAAKGEVDDGSPMSLSQVRAAIRDAGWQVLPPETRFWFILTLKGQRALRRKLDRRAPGRWRSVLAKVLARFAAAVRVMAGRGHARPDLGLPELFRSLPDHENRWGYGPPMSESSGLFDPRVDADFDDDGGLATSPVMRRPPDRSGSGAAAAVPEPGYQFEVETQQIA